MLNKKLKLNPKVFNPDVEKKGTRQGFGEALIELGLENPDVMVLSADLAESTKANLFAEKYPERFIEVGVAEQNMATVASGIASMGKIPFITSYGIFSPGRNWEQIRTTICYNNVPVKIIGSHGGVSVGADGGSHQALEDIALMRVLPNMTVICPADYMEAKKATLACAKTKDPTYIRLSRIDTPIITERDNPFEIGKAQIVFAPDDGKADVGIIATGPILYEAIISAYKLEKEGIKVKVMNLSTIKPLDKWSISLLAKETEAIVTVEDHQIACGLGSAVAEYLSENYPTKIEYVGINNMFGQSGKPEELYKHYKLTSDDISEKVRKVLTRKKSN
jgi:transketolase